MAGFVTGERTEAGNWIISRSLNGERRKSHYVLTLLLRGGAMLTTIRRLGNSQGILIPKPLLLQVGLVDQAELRVEGDALVLRRPKAALRTGWAEASRRLAAAGDDVLVLPEFANESDAELTW
jgi:antitoxin MazE